MTFPGHRGKQGRTEGYWQVVRENLSPDDCLTNRSGPMEIWGVTVKRSRDYPLADFFKQPQYRLRTFERVLTCFGRLVEGRRYGKEPTT